MILTLVGITYFAGFVSDTMRMYADQSERTPLNIFSAGGLLALSLAATYLVFLRMMSKEVESRKVLLLIFVAAAWGALAPLLQIYPWNFVLMIAWIIVGALVCRKSHWELPDERRRETDRT